MTTSRFSDLRKLALALPLVFCSNYALAREECETVTDCANEMVIVARGLLEENAALRKRIEALENRVTKNEVIAIAKVKDGELIPGASSENVSFDRTNGRISFENPNNRNIVPLVTDLDDSAHALWKPNMHYVAETSTTYVRVWRTVLDTGGRWGEHPEGRPKNFTLVILYWLDRIDLIKFGPFFLAALPRLSHIAQ